MKRAQECSSKPSFRVELTLLALCRGSAFPALALLSGGLSRCRSKKLVGVPPARLAIAAKRGVLIAKSLSRGFPAISQRSCPLWPQEGGTDSFRGPGSPLHLNHMD